MKKLLLLFIFLLAQLFAVAQTRIEIDPQAVMGAIKPMNAANNGPFAAYTFDPQPPYYALYYWSQLAALGSQVKAEASEQDIYVCAASDGKTVRVLLANYNDAEGQCIHGKVCVNVPGASGRCRCLITDGSHMNVSRELPVRKGRVSVTLDSYSIMLLEFE